MTKSEYRTFVALAGLTLLTRLALVLWLRTWNGDAGAYEHDMIARFIAAGEGFRFWFFTDVSHPSAHQAPAIPYLLAGAYRVFGAGAPAAKLAVQIVGVLLSVLAVGAAGILAHRWWGGRAMGLAMGGFLVYPAFAYMPTRIQAVNWSAAFALLIIAAFVALGRAPHSRRAGIVAGVAGGIGMLAEPILAAPFGLCWLWMCRRAASERERGRWRGTVAAALTMAVLLAPWTARNAYVLGTPALVKSTFWYVFWEGNHPGASGTDKRPLPENLQRALAWSPGIGRGVEAALDSARAAFVSVDEDLTEEDRRALADLPSEVARVEWFRARSFAELRADPPAYLGLSARRLGMLLWFDDTNPRSFVLAYRLPYLALLGLAVFGLLLIARGVRNAPDGFGFWAAAVTGLFAVHTLVITSARFRLTLEALYLLPAALAVDWLWGRWRRKPPTPPRGTSCTSSRSRTGTGRSAPAPSRR